MSPIRIQPIGSDPAEALSAALDLSPYLRALDRRYAFISGDIAQHGAETTLEQAIATISALGDAADLAAAMVGLRQQKARAHFAIAGLDLAAKYTLTEVTNSVTRLADACVRAALGVAARAAGLTTEGLVIFALGKMGAGELNYSSDIDMAAFFDRDVFDGGAREPGDAAMRLVREAMRILDDRTRDGYVFRTDLRLRPDPSSNPLAVSISRAADYYQSIGQNWERMVWIKGRPVAGDVSLGREFQAMIEPFVWRRHLDYWAIADVRAIKSMINAKTKPLSEEIVNPNVKLGPGGIREIEFFVQTQQIILGGRNPGLRAPATLDGLKALEDAGAVMPETRAALAQSYEGLRHVEHRIQMRLDDQTHTLPSNADDRAQVAALCGYDRLEPFDKDVFDTRRTVNTYYAKLFESDAAQDTARPLGNLVFTGVDDDPGTLESLTALGFREPSQVIASVRQWHRGRLPATRSERGRELLTALLPHLLQVMSDTGEPDQAFRRFGRFLEGLSSGVQTLSMLEAEPLLLEDLITTLALAPRLGDILARRPGLLETLLAVNGRPDTFIPAPNDDFETAINAARVWHGEQTFLIGYRLLHGAISAQAVAGHWSGLADTIIEAMARAAEAETVRLYGEKPGVWAILALGKLGGREMTAGSDLDLIVIYESDEQSDGQTWFMRFTQRLITALSSETGNGSLYEVDMRLRPSGRAGPVATSIAAFERYHHNDAWTWEHMALTRLRTICGDADLGGRAEAIAKDVITSEHDADKRKNDIFDMRQRLARDKPAKGPWDLKMRVGGLIDVEFLVQQAMLLSGDKGVLVPRIGDAIDALQLAGHLPDDEADTLKSSYALLQSLQQIQRLTIGSDGTTERMSTGLKRRFSRALGLEDFVRVETSLEQALLRVQVLRCKKIGQLPTET
ncbi:MAG: bifunctional [glutamine synthetase] adenylyltransferase/[glutamine synthetase]-adenylyl-L-tyrosine phosphorylase [Pseudomonadota bacterium]